MTVDLQDLILVYDGSVKRVWRPPGDDSSYWFEFTDDYSVFDWGKMPDTVANKGKALLAIGAFFFDYLADNKNWSAIKESKYLSRISEGWLKKKINGPVFEELATNGMRHHFQGLVSPAGKAVKISDLEQTDAYMSVMKAIVERPEPVNLLNQTVFAYKHQTEDLRLVPLEVVFRFGMPQGSSLKKRLEKDPSYASKLGLTQVPGEGEWFERPVLEFYTKLEPKDRLLSIQEALLISGLSPERFETLAELTYALALALHHRFAECGIELWDGKFEFLEDRRGLMLADSIGPDELRLVFAGHNLSKEMIRQFYRDTPWQLSLEKAQKMAADRNTLDWQSICIEELKQKPDNLSSSFKNVVNKLYGVLANQVAGYSVFDHHPTLPQFADSIDLAFKEGKN